MEIANALNKAPNSHDTEAVNKVAFFFGTHGRSARTPGFEVLASQDKFAVYKALADAIDLDRELLDSKKSEINLVGESGISLRDGKIRIGTGVRGEEIINFLRNQPEEMTPPAPLNLSGEEKKPKEPKTEPQLIQEPTPISPEPFDADKIVPITPTTEDVSDLLNQPQNQTTEGKPESAEAPISGDRLERVQYFRPSGPRPSAFSPIILANESKARAEQKTEQYNPGDYGGNRPNVEKNPELLAKLERLKADLNQSEKLGIEKDEVLQEKEDEIKKLEVLIQIDQWRRQKEEIRSELEAMEKEGRTKDEILESKVKEIKRIEDIIRNLENPKTQNEVSVEDEHVEVVKPEEVIAGGPVPATSSESTANPNNMSTPVQNWRESEEWKKFEQMREGVARADAPIDQLGMSSIGLEINRSEYRNYKETVAKKIEETLRRQAGSNLTPEQERALEQEIHDTIYEELLKKESDTYVDTFRRHRSESLKDKVKEAAFSLLNTKLARWYLGKNRLTKFAINSALFGAAMGVGAFATGGTAIAAMGAVGYRTARAAGSLVGSTAGAFVGPKIENIEKWEKEEEEKIKNSQDSLEEKTKKFEELKKQAENKKRNLALKKSAITFGLGAGAGVAVGGFLDSYYGGLSLKNELHPNAPKVPTEDQLKSLNERIYAENAPQLLSPENLKHMPENGNSNWSLLKETMEHNDRFAKLEHSGQKSFVISHLNNKVLADPSKYAEGVGKNGEILIGREVNYSKLFEDKKWVDEVLEKAKNLPEDRIKVIEENDAKISAWVKDPAHQGQKLDSKAVEEILNTKPEKEPVVILPKEHFKYVAGDDLGNGDNLNLGGENSTELESVPSENLQNTTTAETPANNKMQEAVDSILEKPKIGSEETEGKTMLAGGGIVAATAFSRNPGNFGVMEGGRNDGVERVRSLEGDSKKAIANIMSAEEAQRHLENDINSIYGKDGILGIGKEKGINTAEWKEIRNQKAKEFCNFYEDRENCKLSKDIIESLNISQKHRNLKGYIDFLRKEAKEATFGSESAPEGANVVPLDREDETVEKYLKRLGAFVAEHPRSPATEVPKGQVMEAALFKKAA